MQNKNILTKFAAIKFARQNSFVAQSFTNCESIFSSRLLRIIYVSTP